MRTPRVTLYDTTLRDGAQTGGVDFSPEDKVALAAELDKFGIPYIELGWPGANDTDTLAFETVKPFTQAKLTAFGMTRRVGFSAGNDPTLSGVLNTRADAYCLVGKTWLEHVTGALRTTPEDNLASIYESMKRAASHGEAVFDAEHFFDAYKQNPDYALQVLRAADEAGARWLTLCDTNGGCFTDEVERIVRDVVAAGIPAEKLGIHTHDDTGHAVANSMVAVNAGAHMVQGTLNGLGERCGNANLVTLIGNFAKRGVDCGVPQENLSGLRSLSHFLDDLLDRPYDDAAPYVGERAFFHKSGLHVSALLRRPDLYEHFNPAAVGNARIVPMSDQAGLANLQFKMEQMGLPFDKTDERLKQVVQDVKEMEANGWAFDKADASFELLLRQRLGYMPRFFELEQVDARTAIDENGKGVMSHLPEATVKLWVNGERKITTAEGNGPVNAIDNALREALVPSYPQLADMRLADYKVRILSSSAATGSVTRVSIVSEGHIKGQRQKWTTIGVSPNIMKASLVAMFDAVRFGLIANDVPEKVARPMVDATMRARLA